MDGKTVLVVFGIENQGLRIRTSMKPVLSDIIDSLLSLLGSRVKARFGETTLSCLLLVIVFLSFDFKALLVVNLLSFKFLSRTLVGFVVTY